VAGTSDGTGAVCDARFHLDLSGTHADHEGGVSPGCHECQQVYDDLQPIATWILPNEERDSYYDIRPFDRSIYYAPTRKFRKEVILSIKILHRHEGTRRTVERLIDFGNPGHKSVIKHKRQVE
jgi:hypothetical protein